MSEVVEAKTDSGSGRTELPRAAPSSLSTTLSESSNCKIINNDFNIKLRQMIHKSGDGKGNSSFSHSFPPLFPPSPIWSPPLGPNSPSLVLHPSPSSIPSPLTSSHLAPSSLTHSPLFSLPFVLPPLRPPSPPSSLPSVLSLHAPPLILPHLCNPFHLPQSINVGI